MPNVTLAAALQGLYKPTTSKSGSYTLALTDNGSLIIFTTSSATTVTLPNNLPAGFKCQIILNGTGAVTLSPATSANLINRDSFTKFNLMGSVGTLFVVSNSNGTNAIYCLDGGDA